MTTKADDFLAHYGVKGMKWGVRRVNVGGKLMKLAPKKKTSVPPSSDHVSARELKGKPLHAMTNDEIKTLTSRLQLETAYTRLTGADISTLDKGQKQVERMLKAGTTLAAVYTLYQSPAGKAAKTFFESNIKKAG